MFSHSTPIIPRGSFQVTCEKIWGSFEVGDHFGSRKVFLGFWFAGLNVKFSCSKNPYFTVPTVSNEGVK